MGKVFMQFDLDNSGALDIEEFKMALKTFGINAKYPHFFDRFDKNKDGTVSLAELEKTWNDESFVGITRLKIEDQLDAGYAITPRQIELLRKRAKGEPIEWKHDMGKVFMQFDLDNSGALDIEEFKMALKTFGINAKYPHFFDRFDKNKDGTVSLAELEKTWNDESFVGITRLKVEDQLDAGWTLDTCKFEIARKCAKGEQF